MDEGVLERGVCRIKRTLEGWVPYARSWCLSLITPQLGLEAFLNVKRCADVDFAVSLRFTFELNHLWSKLQFSY